MILNVNSLTAGYLGTDVLEGVTFGVAAGTITALIGPNGSGKSTLLRAMGGTLGFYRGEVSGGTILLDEKPTMGLRADQLVIRGLTLVPDGRRLFKHMTVRENLQMGAFTVTDKERRDLNHERVVALFPELEALGSRKAGSLSGGEQQMVAIARALMTDPRVLLIDEPSLGLSPRLLATVFEKIMSLRDERMIGVVVVEQNVREVLKIADHVVALKLGKTVYSGGANSLGQNWDELKRVFL